MGLAIIIKDADFSANNLGQVSFLEDVDLTSLALSANDSYEGKEFTPSVSYTPGNTNQKGVVWEITSGGTYATIDSSTGKVTILSAASSAQNITIKATSTYNSSLSATKTISVKYKATVDSITGLTISGDSTVNASNAQYTVTTVPSNSAYQEVTWSISSGSTYATISQTGKLTVLEGASNSSVTIKVTSTHDTNISATKTVTVTYQDSSVLYNLAAPVTFSKTSTPLDTGVNLLSREGRPWTILFYAQFEATSGTANQNSINGNDVFGGNKVPYICFDGTRNNYFGRVNSYAKVSGLIFNDTPYLITNEYSDGVYLKNVKIAIVHDGLSTKLSILDIANNNNTFKANGYATVNGALPASSGNVTIGGCSGMVSVNLKVNKLKILDEAITDEEVLKSKLLAL